MQSEMQANNSKERLDFSGCIREDYFKAIDKTIFHVGGYIR